MIFSVMDYSGHSTIEFKESETKEAMEKFNELVKTHTAAQRQQGDRDYTVTRQFQAADETLFVPMLRGG